MVAPFGTSPTRSFNNHRDLVTTSNYIHAVTRFCDPEKVLPARRPTEYAQWLPLLQLLRETDVQTDRIRPLVLVMVA